MMSSGAFFAAAALPRRIPSSGFGSLMVVLADGSCRDAGKRTSPPPSTTESVPLSLLLDAIALAVAGVVAKTVPLCRALADVKDPAVCADVATPGGRFS